MSMVNPIGPNMADPRFDALSTPRSSADGASTTSFSKALEKAAEEVNSLQNDAATQAQLFVTGQTNDIHSVMIASQKATVALELTTQVRNKVLEAYQEVMRMSM